MSRWLPWAVAAAALVAAVATLWGRPQRGPEEPASRLEISLPPDAAYSGVPTPGRGLALSPDGQVLVYASASRGRRQLYRRQLNRLAIDPIPGSENATQPFFSPDGKWIGFFTTTGELKTAALDGPPVTVLHGVQNPQWAFGTWRDDAILFSLFGPNLAGLRQMSSDGGTANAVTTLGIFPVLVPSTGDIVVTDGRVTGTGRMILVRRDGSQVPLLDNGTAVAVTPSGHLLFTRDDALMAAPFDARSGAVGSPKALSESVMVMDYGVAQLAVSASGTLAYVPPPGANSLP
jgi:serine/threonine-protein kinase